MVLEKSLEKNETSNFSIYPSEYYSNRAVVTKTLDINEAIYAGITGTTNQ